MAALDFYISGNFLKNSLHMTQTASLPNSLILGYELCMLSGSNASIAFSIRYPKEKP